MNDSDKTTQHSDSAILGFWKRIPVVIRAVVAGLFVAEIGIIAWLASMALLPALWPIVVMSGVLWFYLRYFSGSWWPKTTAESRRDRFRALTLPRAVQTWSLAAAMLFVIVSQSSFVLTFRIIEFPAELLTQGLGFDDIPLWAAWMFIVMSALVAGICEETGFRGYMQVPLEKRYGSGVAISITSLMFLLLHLNQAWAPPLLLPLFALGALFGILAYAADSLIPSIIAHAVTDVFNFAYWWTDVAGTFDRRPIADTGIDAHFVLWLLVFVVSITLFTWTARKTHLARKSAANPQ